jgi:hypothetical protein
LAEAEAPGVKTRLTADWLTPARGDLGRGHLAGGQGYVSLAAQDAVLAFSSL